MHVLHSTSPFLHTLIFNLLTEEENNTLYSICDDICNTYEDSINDLSFFVLEKDREILKEEGIAYCKRNGMVMNNVGLFPTGDALKIYHKLQQDIRTRLKSDKFTDIFPILINEKTNKPFEWGIGLTLTSDLKTHQLLPHTDNPEDLIQYGIDNNVSVSCGRYKGVVFITNPDLHYKDYGTRFYNSNERSSEFLEVPFVGGSACIFKTGPNSYHGTEYKNDLPHRRYTLTIEYY